jgi:hypothetical protein
MLSTRKLAVIGAVLAVAASGIAIAETAPDHHSMGPDHHQQMMQTQHLMTPDHMQAMMRQQHQGMMPMGSHAAMHGASTTPTMPGQDAFGAIQEVVRILDADPKTDWSKVDLEALRQHLIDMNEVTLKADADPKPIDGGLEVTITGTGRTLVAIQRMVPAYAQNVNGFNGWIAKAASLPNGELLTVTATDPKEIEHIRGLGFIGLLASGSMHQPHHLAMAKGEFDHKHQGHTH